MTLNPFEEGAGNSPLELGGDRFGQGVFIQAKGASYGPPAQETPQLAQGVDTEGGLAVATTVGLRQSPTVKIHVIEPQDPADVNYVLNPQCVGTTGYTQRAATGGLSNPLVRDLNGFDYALLQTCPGTNANEGVVVQPPNIGSLSGDYTFGVWLKGAAGGEAVTLTLYGTNPTGSPVTTVNVTLSPSWQWYTATRSPWGAYTNPYISVSSTTQTAISFFATGFCLVNETTLQEYFDGTWPGCSWNGAPNNSVSARPAPGGPRRDAIMADIELAVTRMSRLRTGTVRRTMPNGHRITFDVVNATISWDDTSMLNAGVAEGTISFLCQPYGRGPEMAPIDDAFHSLIAANYVMDAGAASNFSYGANGAQALGNSGESRFISVASPYPFSLGEVSGSFVPGLLAPAAPAPTTLTTGGTIAAGTYTVGVTYVGAAGETTVSASGTVTTTGTTSTITIPSPPASTGATGWYAYVSQAGGSSVTRQQAPGSPTAIGTALTLTAPPTSTGAAAPSGPFFKGGVILRRVSAATYLEAYVTDNGVGSTLKIDKVDGGSRFNIASTTLGSRLSNGAIFTVRGRIQHQNGVDNIYAEYFNSSSAAPSSVPLSTLGPATTTFASDPTAYPGNAGAVINPAAANAGIYDLLITPNLARERQLPVLRFGVLVPGTAPALGRMVISDCSGQNQNVVTWGQQQDSLSRTSGSAAASDLFYEAEKLTPLGGAATAAVGGASGTGSNAVQAAALGANLSPVLSTKVATGGLQLTHVGDFAVYARVLPNAVASETWALKWSTGDLQVYTTNAAVAAPQGSVNGQWAVVNLGTVHVPAAVAGKQQWQGVVMAASTAHSQPYVDCIWLVPLNDGSGVAAAPVQRFTPITPGSYVALDYFTQNTGAAINGMTLTGTGGTWIEAGAAGAFLSGNGMVYRSSTDSAAGNSPHGTNGHFAVASGTSAMTSTAVQADVIANLQAKNATGVLARYVSSTSYILGYVDYSTTTATLNVLTNNAGTPLLYQGPTVAFAGASWYTIAMYVDTNGNIILMWGPQGGAITQQLLVNSSLAAAGGALATGYAGIYSWSPTATGPGQSQFENFWATSYVPNAAVYGGNSLEIRSNQVNRQDSGGTIWVPPSSYVGNYMRVPNAASSDDFEHIIVKASRVPNADAIDAIQATVNLTPRYAAIPNA